MANLPNKIVNLKFICLCRSFYFVFSREREGISSLSLKVIFAKRTRIFIFFHHSSWLVFKYCIPE